MALIEATGRRLGRRERMLAVVAATLVIGGVLYAGVFEPALMQWREMSARLEGRQLALARSQRLSQTAEDIEGDFRPWTLGRGGGQYSDGGSALPGWECR